MRRTLLVGLVILLAPLCSVPPAAAEGPRYHGRVVEAGTRQPIPGAVVSVIWMKYPVIIMNGVSDFHGGRETLTDGEGQFSIDATPPFNWNPFRSLRPRPDIIVYSQPVAISSALPAPSFIRAFPSIGFRSIFGSSTSSAARPGSNQYRSARITPRSGTRNERPEGA